MGEGEVRDATGALADAGQALRAAGLTPVTLQEKEGLALINGTDGMLGMLVLACHDLRQLVRTADIGAAMSVEAQLGTDAVFAADLQALRPQPGQADSAANLRCACCPARLGHHGQPSRSRVHPRPGRLLAALLAAGARRGPRHHRARRAGRLAGAGQRYRQPGGHAGRPGGEQRQLPRRAGGLRAGLPGHRRRRPGIHRRAAHRPLPGHFAQPRPDRVPGRRSRAWTPNS